MNRDFTAAAKELGCSEAWLRRNVQKSAPTRLPHIKFGGGNGPVVFTDEHIEQIRAMHEIAARTPVAELRPVARRRAS